MDEDPAKAVVLRALKERADQVIKSLEERKVTGMAAMDEIAALVVEKEEARKAARASGLSDTGFAVHWQLGRDEALTAAGLDTLAVAREVEILYRQVPNWSRTADEQRRLRLNLYKPVITLGRAAQGRGRTDHAGAGTDGRSLMRMYTLPRSAAEATRDGMGTPTKGRPRARRHCGYAHEVGHVHRGRVVDVGRTELVTRTRPSRTTSSSTSSCTCATAPTANDFKP